VTPRHICCSHRPPLLPLQLAPSCPVALSDDEMANKSTANTNANRKQTKNNFTQVHRLNTTMHNCRIFVYRGVTVCCPFSSRSRCASLLPCLVVSFFISDKLLCCLQSPLRQTVTTTTTQPHTHTYIYIFSGILFSSSPLFFPLICVYIPVASSNPCGTSH